MSISLDVSKCWKKIRFHTMTQATFIQTVKLGATKNFCIYSDEGKTGHIIHSLLHCYFAIVMRRLIESDQNNAKVPGESTSLRCTSWKLLMFVRVNVTKIVRKKIPLQSRIGKVSFTKTVSWECWEFGDQKMSKEQNCWKGWHIHCQNIKVMFGEKFGRQNFQHLNVFSYQKFLFFFKLRNVLRSPFPRASSTWVQD